MLLATFMIDVRYIKPLPTYLLSENDYYIAHRHTYIPQNKRHGKYIARLKPCIILGCKSWLHEKFEATKVGYTVPLT